MKALQIVPDRFSEIAKASSKGANEGLHSRTALSDTNHIRRMTRGIVLKDDSFATLRVVTGGNSPVKIVDAGSRRMEPGSTSSYMQIGEKRATDLYSNFLITQVQEERMEKQQIVETFGEAYIFLYGERARIISITGILANTFDFNWEAEWWYNYENFLRGTKCVEADARVFLSYDTTLVGGYIISSAATKLSQERNYVQFQFNLFVTSYTNFSDIGNPSAGPIEDGKRALNVDVSEDEALAYRPALLTDIGAGNPPPGGSLIHEDRRTFGAIDTGSQKLFDTIANFFGNLGKGVDNVISTTSQLLNGELVRVPVGYLGTLAYDEESNIKIRDVKFGGKVTYSTFDKNDDEYVGRGDQYDSSDPNLTQNYGGRTIADIFGSQADIDRVSKAWKDRGIAIPSTQLGAVSKLLVQATVGLTALGASRLWSTFATPGAIGQFGTALNQKRFGTSDVSQLPNVSGPLFGIHFPE